MLNRDRIALEIRRARRPFVVLLVLAACAVVVSATLISNQTFQRPWDGYTEIRAAFDDAKGVVAGQQPVRIAGVNVGLIKDVELDGRRAILTLAIRDRYAPIHRDATVRLRPKTPLQDMYAELKRGTPRAGKLAPDAVLPARQTVTPVDVSHVLQTFNADTRVRLRALLHGFGSGLADRGAALRRAFVELAPFLTTANAVADQLAERRTRLRRLVSATGSLMSELGRRDRGLAGLVRSGHATLGRLGREDRALRDTIAELPGTVAELRRSLTAMGRAQDELDPALVALQPIAGRLGPALTALHRLADDLDPAARALRPAVKRLTPLARRIPGAARGLAATTAALRPQVIDVDKVQRQLHACRIPFARFFSWTLSVIKFRDGYSAYPRGTVTAGTDTLHDNKSGLTGMTKPPNCSGLVR